MTPAADFDVVVVGMGMSAAPLIEHLMTSGLRVLIIERGAQWDPDKPSASAIDGDRVATIPRSRDHFLLRSGPDSTDVGEKWWATGAAGGGHAIWYGQVSRFRNSDFLAASHFRQIAIEGVSDVLLGDWPVDANAMAPFYDEIEQKLAPSTARFNMVTKPRQHMRYVRIRPYLSHFEREISRALHQMGFPHFSTATARGGRRWLNAPVDPLTLAPRSPFGGPSDWFWRILGRLPNAAVDVAWNSYASSIDRSGNHFEVRYTSGAAQTSVRARKLVLATGALETVRLLLNSDLPDPFRQTGTRFTFTTEAECFIATKIPRSRKARDIATGSFASITVPCAYDGDHRLGIGKGGKIAIYDAHSSDLAADLERKLGRSYTGDDAPHYLLKLSFKGESIPYPGKNVALSTSVNAYGHNVPLINYALHEHDHRVLDTVVAMFKAICAGLPGSEILAIKAPRSGLGTVSAHQHGGAAMSSSPDEGVLNGDCEHWQVPGLFVADGASMPSSAATNSTLTLLANALRIGRKLTE